MLYRELQLELHWRGKKIPSFKKDATKYKENDENICTQGAAGMI
jgi:hypothetical protein